MRRLGKPRPRSDQKAENENIRVRDISAGKHRNHGGKRAHGQQHSPRENKNN